MALSTPGVISGPVVSPDDGNVLARLRAFLAGHHGQAVLSAPDGSRTEVPAEVVTLMEHAVDALSEGVAVTVTAVPQRLTTTQAAELLGVSRPTLVRMLEDNKLPYEQVNVHRSLRLSDVLAYKQRQADERRAVLDDMTREAVAHGLYDVDADTYDQALAEARHHRAR